MAKRHVNRPTLLLILVCAGVLGVGGLGWLVVSLQPSQEEGALEVAAASDDAAKTHADVDQPDPSQFPSRSTEQAWFQLSAEERSALSNSIELPHGAVPVRVSDQYKQWLLGTPVRIYLPQTDEMFAAVVERMEPDAFGNTTIHAGPDDEEDVFKKLILTFNSQNTLAYVSTKAGNYELAATGTIGVLVPGSSLGVTKDPTVPDVGSSKPHRYEDAEYVPRESD